MGSITSLKCVLTQEHLDAVCAKYFVPEEVHPQLPHSDATMHERPAGKVGMYTRFFDYANYRIPFSNFFVSVLIHFRIPFSQLSVFGSAKVSHFEILCRVCNIEPDNWNDHFFWVDEFVVPANARFRWFSGSTIAKDRAPAPSEYDIEHVNTLIAHASPFLRFPEEFLCWVGISQMDLNAFIRTADPRKVKTVERARVENEIPIVTVAKHRTVTLLPTSVPRTSGELSASVEREFAGDASTGDGADQGVDSVVGGDYAGTSVPVTEPVVADIPRPKRSKKKRVVYDSEGLPVASHPPKKLRADYGDIGGSATGGKSLSALNRLLETSRLSVEQGVPTLPTLPFITSSVTASPLEEGGDRTDSVTGPSLRTIGPSVRFVVLSDSSHHSGTNSAGPEVDSLARSDAPLMTEATTVTIPTDVTKDKSTSRPPLFGSSSSSEKTDHTLSLFTGRSGSGFDAGSIREEEAIGASSEEVYVPEWTVTKGFGMNDGRLCAKMIDHFTPPAFFKTVRGMEHEQLFTEFNVSAARNLSLSSEVRMRAEYNILEKRKWKSLAEERNVLLEAKDREIEDLKSQLLKAKEESAEVTRLRVQVSGFEATESSLRGEVASAHDRNVVTGLESIIAGKDQELSDLGASSSSLRSENQSLLDQVHKLELSSADLRLKLETYEGVLAQLEEFQDNLMGPLRTRLAEIDADFTRCCMRFQESFHPHLLNVIAGRRWLLTHGVKLLLAKCLNSNEYMEALGHAFGRAIEKGMQEGLAAGIEHGQAGRCLAELEAYIPSAEDDFNSAIRDLRDLNFPLLQELSNKKDATLDVFASIEAPLSAEALIEPSAEVPATNVLSTVVIAPPPDPFHSVLEDYDHNLPAFLVREKAAFGVRDVEEQAYTSLPPGVDLILSQIWDEEAMDAVFMFVFALIPWLSVPWASFVIRIYYGDLDVCLLCGFISHGRCCPFCCGTFHVTGFTTRV
ncbi:hypothetical protein Tco_0251644 [Tanacetum coccineum]